MNFKCNQGSNDQTFIEWICHVHQAHILSLCDHELDHCTESNRKKQLFQSLEAKHTLHRQYCLKSRPILTSYVEEMSYYSSLHVSRAFVLKLVF